MKMEFVSKPGTSGSSRFTVSLRLSTSTAVPLSGVRVTVSFLPDEGSVSLASWTYAWRDGQKKRVSSRTPAVAASVPAMSPSAPSRRSRRTYISSPARANTVMGLENDGSEAVIASFPGLRASLSRSVSLNVSRPGAASPAKSAAKYTDWSPSANALSNITTSSSFSLSSPSSQVNVCVKFVAGSTISVDMSSFVESTALV